MKQRSFLAVFVALAAAFAANAGVLENNTWSPGGCGVMPEAPAIDSSSVDAFNQSIGMINSWQEQVQAYHDCMIKEANADSATINQAVAAEQARVHAAIEKLNAEAASGRTKVEQGVSSRPSLSPSLSTPVGPVPGSQDYQGF